MWVVNATPVALPPGKSRYPLYRRLVGLVWTGPENFAPTGIRSPDRPARSESLYLLSYPGMVRVSEVILSVKLVSMLIKKDAETL